MDEENKNENKNPAFESLDVLISRWKDGTFSEIIDDWKWIFSYSARYKGAIAFYVILGIFSTSMGLVSSVASKYMIDVGHDPYHGRKYCFQSCFQQHYKQDIYETEH